VTAAGVIRLVAGSISLAGTGAAVQGACRACVELAAMCSI
jgi:hypothetical protein